MKTYLMVAGGVLFCGIIMAVIRSPGILKKITASAAAGLATLAVIDLTSAFTGVHIAVSIWTVATAVVLGLPGIVSLLFLKVIWNL